MRERPGRRPFFAGLAVGVVLALAGAALWQAGPLWAYLGVTPWTFDARDRHVTVPVGDTFVIEVEDNASTGFRWIVEGPDGSVVERIGEEYEADSPDLVGSGGTLSLRFRAVAEGRTEIALRHCFRCGGADEDTSAEKRLFFSVSVRA